MKRLALIIGSGLLFSAATASAEISGNVSLATDYSYRGISQTLEHPAIQGGLDVTADNGLYAGVWASNVDFGTGEESSEFDFYAGYGGSFSDDVGFDVGILRYQYPGGSGGLSSSFTELYGSISFYSVTLGAAYSNDFFLETDKATYLYADYELGLPNDFGLAFHYGNQSIKDNAGFGTPDYSEYSIGLSKSAADLDFSLTWHDTDLSKAECFGGSELCESRVIFAVGKSL